MNSVWIWVLPAFFLPNFGLGANTGVGVLEFSDYVMLFFVPLIYLSPKIKGATNSTEIKKLGLLFVFWASATILGIYLWYPYNDPKSVMLFSFLKLAKFALYAYVGLQISQALTSEKQLLQYRHSLLNTGIVIGLALSFLKILNQILPPGAVLPGFKATNLVSAALAILFVYVFGLYQLGYGPGAWRKHAVISMIVMGIGLSFSAGRGGWVAAAAGALFLGRSMKIRFRTVLVYLGLATGVMVLYFVSPPFAHQVDSIFFRSDEYLTKYKAGIAGIDDGARLMTWENEAVKLADAFVFGRGFHHRGGSSGLWPTGSHNFWLQIFLETGLVGGALILMIFLQMWKHARRYRKVNPIGANALSAALVTAFIGGLSGEYFYGGYGLLILFMVYAEVGSYARVRASSEIMANADSNSAASSVVG